jgi:hypothetical protein
VLARRSLAKEGGEKAAFNYSFSKAQGLEAIYKSFKALFEQRHIEVNEEAQTFIG